MSEVVCKEGVVLSSDSIHRALFSTVTEGLGVVDGVIAAEEARELSQVWRQGEVGPLCYEKKDVALTQQYAESVAPGLSTLRHQIYEMITGAKLLTRYFVRLRNGAENWHLDGSRIANAGLRTVFELESASAPATMSVRHTGKASVHRTSASYAPGRGLIITEADLDPLPVQTDDGVTHLIEHPFHVVRQPVGELRMVLVQDIMMPRHNRSLKAAMVLPGLRAQDLD